MGENDPQPAHIDDVALKQYESILRYLATENQIFWSRSQLFLVANAALLGFVLGNIPSNICQTAYAKLGILLFGAITGLTLCRFWRRALAAGRGWFAHWKSILVKLEARAFGELDLFRTRPREIPSSAQTAEKTATLFLWIWVLVVAYTGLCFALKLAGKELP